MQSFQSKPKQIEVICPKCKKIPLISLVDDIPDLIKINCLCPERKVLVKDYLRELRANDYVRIEKRADVPFFFCSDCKEHIRSAKVGDEHKGHKVINMNTYLPPKILSTGKNILAQARGMRLYSLALIEKVKILFDKCLNDLRKAYNDNLAINEPFLNLCEILINNCDLESPNYYSYTNFLTNCKLVPPKININDKDIKLCDYNEVFNYIKNSYFNEKKKKDLNIPPKEPQPQVKKEEIKKIELPQDLRSSLKKIKSIKDDANPCSLLLLKDGRLAVGELKSQIKIFNLDTYENELTLVGHTDRINTLSLLEDGRLLSASQDKSVKIWKIEKYKYECLKTFVPHDEEIVFVVSGLTKNRFMTSSTYDMALWTGSEPYKVIHDFFDAHSDTILFIHQLKGKEEILTFGFEGKLKRWSLDTLKMIKELDNLEGIAENNFIELSDGTFLLGSIEQIYVIDLEAFTVKTTIEFEKESPFCFAQLEDGRIIFTSDVNLYQLMLGDVNDYEMLMEGIHEDEVSSMIYLGNKKMISTGGDDNINVFTF